MINTSIFLERFLQNYRFKMARSYLNGDVLDFGGNEGELKTLVKGRYVIVNYDHSAMEKEKFDTIMALAVIEHIQVDEVFEIFKKFRIILKENGIVFLTTPTKMAKPVLELLAFVGLVDKVNIEEHKHYWSKKDIFNLAQKSGFKIKKYRRFQLGFNQLAIME